MRNHASKVLRALALVAIAVLAASGFGLSNIADEVRLTRAYEDLHDLAPRFEEYRLRSGRIPTTEEGFDPLIKRPVGEPGKWKRILDLIPQDPWGNRYRYRKSLRNGVETPEVLSTGKDGLIDTEDDLSSLDSW
jgi:general secretion pathway protein G